MSGNSPRDLLIAEMLGDIGKLHDEVRVLNESVPHIANSIENAIAESVRTLRQLSAEILKATSEAYEIHHDKLAELTVARKAELLEAMQREANSNIDRLSSATGSLLNDMVEFSDRSTAAAIMDTVRKTVGVEAQKLKETISDLADDLVEIRRKTKQFAIDDAELIKSAIDKAKSNPFWELAKMVGCALIATSIATWLPALKQIYKVLTG